jgi:uncharacterized protein (DUF2336 family)
MSMAGERFALLKDLEKQGSSEDRRALLRRVTDTLGHTTSEAELSELDSVLSVVASEYSQEVRMQLAKLVLASITGFEKTTERFAGDVIDVAGPVLRHSRILSDDALMRVVARKSQPHMLAMTQRANISARVSHALVEEGDDTVVTSLLANTRAEIADATFEVVARRAETSPVLQAPLVKRKEVPLDILHTVYHKVEKELHQQIIEKFGQVSPAELEKAFSRSRSRLDTTYHKPPEDFGQAQTRVAQMAARQQLTPASLATLLREGPAARTAFKLAFARMADIEYDVIDRAVEGSDMDTLALVCRGAGFDRALFVTLAIGLAKGSGLANAESFGQLYEEVPVQAAQRALRFWKVRATGT